ncbi:MAG: EpsI family protein [Bryobacteraceae bacterium]|nr:MAG: EpsI family protein [Bryobacteraceae bacterium]
MSWWRGRGVWVATAVLCAQAVAFHVFSQNEHEPKVLPLALVNFERGGWALVEDEPLDSATAEILHPDDFVYRVLADSRRGLGATVFVAYFRSQRTGHAPHTPRNCLPGHGWVFERTGTYEAEVAGAGRLRANRYVIQKENERAAVVYWYQTGERTVANEYEAKLWLVWDAMRHGRSDTALVRVIVPAAAGVEEAERAAEGLAREVYAALVEHFPRLEPLKGT